MAHFAQILINGSSAVFPGLVESIDNKDFDNAAKWMDIINECIKTATKTVKK